MLGKEVLSGTTPETYFSRMQAVGQQSQCQVSMSPKQAVIAEKVQNEATHNEISQKVHRTSVHSKKTRESLMQVFFLKLLLGYGQLLDFPPGCQVSTKISADNQTSL